MQSAKTQSLGSLSSLEALAVFAIAAPIIALVTVAYLVYAALSEGFVLWVLWGWFVTPLFGIATPPIAYLIGLALLIGLVVRESPTYYKEHDAAAGKTVIYMLLRPWLFLAIAYVVHLFV